VIRIDKVPIDKIKKNPKFYPDGFNKRKWEEFARSISQVSILEMVIVKETDDGYLQFSGDRRIKANKESGKEEISAIVVDEFDLDPEKKELIKNLQPEEIDPLERAMILDRYIKEEDLTKRDASKKLGMVRTTLTVWLIILEYEEKYQQAVIDNFHGKEGANLTVSHLALAKNLESTTDNHELATQFLDIIMDYGLTRRESIKLKELIKKHPAVDIKEVAENFTSQRELEDEIAKDEASEEIREIIEIFDNVNSKMENIIDVSYELDKRMKKKLLKELLLTEQKLQQISIETFGKTLKKSKEELL
jgi:ParB/RepB/Spo0J family partition protein